MSMFQIGKRTAHGSRASSRPPGSSRPTSGPGRAARLRWPAWVQRRTSPPAGTGGAESADAGAARGEFRLCRSEEHTSELQSLMRISYAVFCLKKKKHTNEEQV